MTGIVTLSLELELAWGTHDLDDPDRYAKLSRDRRRETAYFRDLLAVCDRLHVPLTVDVVGHLLHTGCDGDHDGPHPPGWFDEDPASTVTEAPHFYAPDLVEAVVDARVDHELATHTYSHVLCDEVPDEVVAWELRTATAGHEAFGLDPPTSLVTPRNRPVDPALLREHGITAVRVLDPTYERPTGTARRVAWWAHRTHPVHQPRTVGGVLETYCTPHPSLTAEYLPSGRGESHSVLRAIPVRARARHHRRYLEDAVERAAASDRAVHLWTHLFDLANPEQFAVVVPFLESLAAARDRGAVEIHTMASIAARELGSSSARRDTTASAENREMIEPNVTAENDV